MSLHGTEALARARDNRPGLGHSVLDRLAGWLTENLTGTLPLMLPGGTACNLDVHNEFVLPRPRTAFPLPLGFRQRQKCNVMCRA